MSVAPTSARRSAESKGLPPRQAGEASARGMRISERSGDARSVLVVGGSPEAPSPGLLARLAQAADLVVACDRGADACLAAGARVDVLVGDDDSVSAEGLRHVRACGAEERRFPMDKDAADLGLAIDLVRARFPRLERLTLTGVSGGRVDHGLAVLGTLARAADLAPTVEEDAFELRVLSPQGRPGWELGAEDLGRTLSVIAALGPAVVSESGMRWNLDRSLLQPLSDLGLSNVVERAPARVESHRGVALAILRRAPIEKRVTQV